MTKQAREAPIPDLDPHHDSHYDPPHEERAVERKTNAGQASSRETGKGVVEEASATGTIVKQMNIYSAKEATVEASATDVDHTKRQIAKSAQTVARQMAALKVKEMKQAKEGSSGGSGARSATEDAQSDVRQPRTPTPTLWLDPCPAMLRRSFCLSSTSAKTATPGR